MDDDTQPCLADEWLTPSEQEECNHLLQQMKLISVYFDPKPFLERENSTQNPPPDDLVQMPRQDLNTKELVTCEPVPRPAPPQMHAVPMPPPEPPPMPTAPTLLNGPQDSSHPQHDHHPNTWFDPSTGPASKWVDAVTTCMWHDQQVEKNGPDNGSKSFC